MLASISVCAAISGPYKRTFTGLRCGSAPIVSFLGVRGNTARPRRVPWAARAIGCPSRDAGTCSFALIEAHLSRYWLSHLTPSSGHAGAGNFLGEAAGRSQLRVHPGEPERNWIEDIDLQAKLVATDARQSHNSAQSQPGGSR